MSTKTFLFLKKFAIPMTLFLGISFLYLNNLSHSIYGYDSGDFASAISVRGIPHAPGYPLYTMLGILSNYIPLSFSVAWKIGLISVFSSSIATALVYFIALDLTKNKLLGVLSSLMVAFLYPFWLYAEVAEVMALNNLFSVLLIFITIRFLIYKKDIYLFLLFFFAGLSLTHNQVIILLFPPILIGLALNFKKILKISVILKCILFFAAGLLPYLYLPIAASFKPLINTNNPVNLENFLHLVLRKDYGWGVGSPTKFEMNSLLFYFDVIRSEVNFIIIATSIIGALYLFYKKLYSVLLFLALVFIFTGPFFFIYARVALIGYFDIGKLERFVQTSTIIVVIFSSLGIYFITTLITSILSKKIKSFGDPRSKILTYIFLFIFFVLPFNAFFSNFYATNLSKITIGDRLAEDILISMPRDSIAIIYDDAAAYSVNYLQFSKGIRTDVYAPTDYSDLNSFVQKDKILKERVNFLLKKYKNIDTVSLLLLTLYPQREKIPIFYVYLPLEDVKLYHENIDYIPYGLLLKLAVKEDLELTKEEFIKKQEDLFKEMQFDYLKKNEDIINTNYNFIHIRSLYARAYLNTAIYLRNHYKDEKSAESFLKKAINLDHFSTTTFSLDDFTK